LEETDKEFALKINHLDADSFVKMLINAKPRDDLDMFSVRPFVSKKRLTSNYVPLPGTLSVGSNLHYFFSGPPVFQPISIKAELKNDNLHFVIVGTKQKTFEFSSARLLLLGKAFWKAARSLPRTFCSLTFACHFIQFFFPVFPFFFLLRSSFCIVRNS
jgi:hypothetical protein